MYHYINFLFLLAVVPLETIISSSATCKTIYKSLPLLTKLCIDKSSQLNIKVARRFRDIKEIRINCLLSSTVIDETEDGPLREINLDFQSALRVISYLSQFDKLVNVSFGGTDADDGGKVIEKFCPADQYFWEGDEMYPNEGSREEMFRFLDNISIGYSSRALSKHVHISGLCCPDTSNQRGGNRRCETCSLACKTFPLESVLTFESRGSSSNSALSNRPYSLDCCLSRAEIESILESRPGGRELLRTEQRVLYLLGNARRYKIGNNESENPLYMVKYSSMEIEELQRSINYSEIDVKRISSHQITAAISRSFGSASQSSCFISSSSLTQLRELGFANVSDEFNKSLQDLVLYTDEIMSVVTGERNDGTSDIEIDCLRLLRLFIEEIENLPRQSLTSAQISTLLTTLKGYLSNSHDFQIEAIKCFVGILSKGADEDKERVFESEIGPSFTRLLCSTNDFIVNSAMDVLSIIVTNGAATNIKGIVSEVVKLGETFDFGSLLLSGDHSVVNSTLVVLAAVKDDINVDRKKALLPHIVHIMKSSNRVDMLTNCSALVNNIFAIDEPPIQKIIDTGALVTIATIAKVTDSSIVYTHLANAMLTLASKCNPDELPTNLRVGFVRTLIELQDSSFSDISTRAISTLHDIAADRDNIVTCESWRERETLQFGEYSAMELVDSDAEDSSTEEEAEEVDDETLRLEIDQSNETSGRVAVTEVEQAEDVIAESPSLTGIPNILLKKVMLYLEVHEVIQLDGVCKRLYQMAWSTDFWKSSPYYLMRGSRQKRFEMLGLRQIRKHQKSSFDIISFVLSGETKEDYDVTEESVDAVEERFRDIAAAILSRMNHSSAGHDVCFRLRCDTVGYLLNFLEGYMIKKMEQALLAAIHCNRVEVQKEDVALVQKEFHSAPANYFDSPEYESGESQQTVEMALDENGSCHCSIPSFSETEWCWPKDDCHGLLPAEDGRRIIRRLAYRAGINQMTADAFMLLETELLYVRKFIINLTYPCVAD